MEALHHLYRPKTLNDVVGQTHVLNALKNAIKFNRIHPAYLFTGAHGTGKTSVARAFARSINCLKSSKPTVKPCGTCKSCIALDKGSHFDVIEIDAASNSSVNDARDLIEKLALSPVFGKYRVFIVDECHGLTDNAMQSLLKSIEEPPPCVIFIFCTTEVQKVLPTIISRCQRYDFRAIRPEQVTEHLRYVADKESIDIENEALQTIARITEGGLRDALQLLSQAALTDGKVDIASIIELAGGITNTDLLSILKSIANKDVLGLLTTARSIIDNGRSPKLLITTLAHVYRDLLLIKSASEQAAGLTRSQLSVKHLTALANRWNYPTIDKALAHLNQAEYLLQKSTNTTVFVEVFLLGLIPGLGVPSELPTFLPLLEVNEQPADSTAVVNHTNGISNGKATTATATVTKLDANKIWQQVIDSTKRDNVKALLSTATLRLIKPGKAILVVNEDKLSRFETNRDVIATKLCKTSGLEEIKLKIEVSA